MGEVAAAEVGRRSSMTGLWPSRDAFVRAVVRMAPFLLVAIALGLRLYGYNFDDGQLLQPDELAIDQTVTSLGCCLGDAGQVTATWPSPLTDFFNSSMAPYDPHLFNYGSLPLYLLAMVTRGAAFAGHVFGPLTSWRPADDIVHTNWIGRWLSALCDAGSLITIYRLGIRTFDKQIALLALAFGTFCVLQIQLSHFYAVDTMVTLFVLLTLLLAVKVAQGGSLSTFLIMGAFFGAALATKSSAFILVLPMLWASVAPVISRHGSSVRDIVTGIARERVVLLNRRLLRLFASLLAAVVIFVICEPYGIIDRSQLVSDVTTQNAIIVSHSELAPYTLQFTGTTPYLFFLKNLVLWYLGPALGITSCAGFVWLTFRALRVRISSAQMTLLAFVIPYLAITGRFWAKFGRYLLPVTPLLYLLAAGFLISIVRLLPGKWSWLGRSIIALVLLSTAGWALAYMNVYSATNNQIAASRWMYTHIAPNTPFATEGEWDRSLPFCLPQRSQCPAGYGSFQMNLFSPDDPAKLYRLVHALTSDKFIVMSTQRFVDSIPRVPNEYPLTTRYYRLLFNNKLNFRLVKRFAVHPRIGPWVLNDLPADENFTVFDHPDVRIFRRIRSITVARATYLLTHPVNKRLPIPEADDLPPARSRLGATGRDGYSVRITVNKPRAPTNKRSVGAGTAGSHAGPLTPPPVQASSGRADSRLMLRPAQWREDQDAPTYDQMFPPNGFGMSHPIALWLLLIEILGLTLVTPMAYIFGTCCDRGWVIAKSLSLIVIGWLVWSAVSLGWFVYDSRIVWVAIGMVLAAGAVLWWLLRKNLRRLLLGNGRGYLIAEAVFLTGFAAFILLRMWYPDLGHQFSPVSPSNVGDGRMGEKQLELAFTNAIARSRTFPPLDPFFAGGYINYYYFGYIIVATLCKATTIAPATGFNLAIATFFALLVGTAYSIGRTLTGSIKLGLCTALFVGCIGNLNGLVQAFDDIESVSNIHVSFPIVGGLLDFASGLISRRQLPPFDFWQSTRLVPPLSIDFAEFPYFSYLFGDLHAHVMAMPVDLAVLAISLLLALSLGKMNVSRVAGVVLVSGFLLGDIEATNPLDMPVCLLVLLLGFLIGMRRVPMRSRLTEKAGQVTSGAAYLRVSWLGVKRFVYCAGLTVAAGVLAVVLFPPLTQGYHPVFPTGLGTVASQAASVRAAILAGQPQLSGANLSQAVRDAMVTPLSVFWEIFGLFLFIIVSWQVVNLVCVYRRHARHNRREHGMPWVLGGGLGILAAGCLFLALLDRWLLAFLAVATAGTIFLVLNGWRRSPVRALWLQGLIGIALALSLFSELFFVRDYLSGGLAFRMNTVAKLYIEIWLLLAIASIGALSFLLRTRPHRRRAFGTAPSRQPMRLPIVKIWSALLAIGVAGSLIYTFAGTVARETYRETWLSENSVPFALDGMAFMRVAYPGDYAAINWMNRHIRGTPTIIEADQADYNWRSRIAQFTGLPTLYGGIYETAQRYEDEVAPRQAALEEIYGATSSNVTTTTLSQFHLKQCLPNKPWSASCVSLGLLKAYHVSYVYVGLMERQLWPDGVGKFSRMSGLTGVFHQGNVFIYHVDGSET